MTSSVTLCLLLVAMGASASAWDVVFEEETVTVHMTESLCVNFSAPVTEADVATGVVSVRSSRYSVALVDRHPVLSAADVNDSIWSGCLSVKGIFLGNADIFLSISSSEGNKSADPLGVIVIREQRVIDSIFTASVAILVSILYINFGCALDWTICKETLKRPIGPVIGFVCQFGWMPVSSYFIGLLLFPDDPEMRIGMFFAGISPAGGASNIWTVILGGNLNLSVTMTTISTLAAFGMMPLWIFTLGKSIFNSANLGVPYSRIAMFAVGLVIPLGIGYLIQKKMPRLTRLLVRILKPFSTLLIVAIIVFAIATNLYLFELFSWRIVVAGVGLPWLGYLFGFLIALVLRRPGPDITAISVETGVQNTGISIFLLRFSLPQPAADLTTIAPVAVAIMTPIPLTILFIVKLIRDRRRKKADSAALEKSPAAVDPASAIQPTIAVPDKTDAP